MAALNYATRYQRISIHAPLAGCDGMTSYGLYLNEAFQSTHPLRGATVHAILLDDFS